MSKLPPIATNSIQFSSMQLFIIFDYTIFFYIKNLDFWKACQQNKLECISGEPTANVNWPNPDNKVSLI